MQVLPRAREACDQFVFSHEKQLPPPNSYSGVPSAACPTADVERQENTQLGFAYEKDQLQSLPPSPPPPPSPPCNDSSIICVSMLRMWVAAVVVLLQKYMRSTLGDSPHVLIVFIVVGHPLELQRWG